MSVSSPPTETTNPVKVMRENLNLTQAKFAALVGISRSTVIRVEQGLYNEIPPSVVHYLTLAEPDVYLNLRSEYRSFKAGQRYGNAAKLIPLQEVSFSIYQEVHPLIEWREASGYTSRLGFCTDFCLHPAGIIDFERGNKKRPPVDLLETLEQLDSVPHLHNAWSVLTQRHNNWAYTRKALNNAG